MDKLELTTGRLSRDVKEGGITLIQISLQHPVIDGGGNSAALELRHCFAQAAENIVTVLSQNMLAEARAAADFLPESLPYQISGTFTSTYNAHGVLSFFTDIFLYAGGLRGITYRCGSSFLTADGGRALFLTALFPTGTDIREVITDFVAEVYRKRQGLEVLSESALSALREFYSPENIYLTENGLVVFYQSSTIAPVASGISVFVMPYNTTGPFPPTELS